MTAKKKLREAENSERKKAKIAERKNDTRRKILLGGFVIAKLRQHNTDAHKLYDEFLTSLDKNTDRKLFDFPPINNNDV